MRLSLVLRELLTYPALLTLFCVAGRPLARWLPAPWPAAGLAAPVLAAGWFAVLSTLCYRAGLAPRSALVPLFLVAALEGWVLAKAHLGRPASQFWHAARPALGWFLCGAGVLLLALAPSWLGGPRFALFQGNHWDERNYTSAAVAYRLYTFAELDPGRRPSVVAAPLRPPADARTPPAGFEQNGSRNLAWRPPIAIAFAALADLLPRSLMVSGYGFRASLQALWYFATAFLLVAVLGVGAVRGACLAAALALGFYAQYVFDISAWSELLGVPLALVGLGTLAQVLERDEAAWRQAVRVAFTLVPVAYVYPELGFVFLVPCVLGPAYLVWRGRARLVPTLLVLVTTALLVLVACVPFWTGTVVFIYKQLTEGAAAFEPPQMSRFFQAYWIGGDDHVPEGSLWLAYGELARGIHWLAAFAGVYFLRPAAELRTLTRVVLRLALSAALLCLLWRATRAAGRRLQGGGVRGALTVMTLASALVPWARWVAGYPWQAGKGFSMIAPLWFVWLVLPLTESGSRSWRRFEWPALLLVLAHLGFGLGRLPSARSMDGLHYAPPYPAVQDVALKRGRNLDLDRLQARLDGCQSVAVSLEDVWQEAFVQAYLSDVGVAWSPRRAVRAYDTWATLVAGSMRKRVCLLAQGAAYALPGERLIWWEPGTLQVRAAPADSRCSERANLPAPVHERRAKGDLDGDGRADLFFQDSAGGEVFAWLMHDTECVGEVSVSPTPEPGARLVAVADFDADGRNELVFERPERRSLELWRLQSDQAGLRRLGAPETIPLTERDESLRLAGSADLDRDGYADLLWQDPSSGGLQVWTMNGGVRTGVLTPQPLQPVDRDWLLVGAPDLDGDGQADLLFENVQSSRAAFWLLDRSLHRRTGLLLPAAGEDWHVAAWLPRPERADGATLVWRNDRDGGLRLWDVSPSGELLADRPSDPAPPPVEFGVRLVGPR